jgi:hypothetical protein
MWHRLPAPTTEELIGDFARYLSELGRVLEGLPLDRVNQICDVLHQAFLGVKVRILRGAAQRMTELPHVG